MSRKVVIIVVSILLAIFISFSVLGALHYKDYEKNKKDKENLTEVVDNDIVNNTQNDNNASCEIFDFLDSEIKLEDQNIKKVISKNECYVDNNDDYVSVIKSIDTENNNNDLLDIESTIKDISNGNIVLKTNRNNLDHIPVYLFKNNFILEKENCTASCSDYYSSIYTSGFKKIIDNIEIKEEDISFTDDSITIKMDGELLTFDSNGNIQE